MINTLFAGLRKIKVIICSDVAQGSDSAGKAGVRLLIGGFEAENY
jgi:hypothetical protein